MGDMLIEDPQTESTFIVSGMVQKSFNKLFEFFEKDILCDVTISAGNKQIRCHRNVLASCSPYFQAMFTSPLVESSQKDIIIGDIDGVTMEIVIKFAYTAKVELNILNAQSLLHASSILQFDSLAHVCCEFMYSQFHPSNCLGIRELAHRLGQEKLIEKSDNFIRYHFKKIIVEEEFLSISAKLLEDIISSSDLFVESEIEVYEALIKWIEHSVEERGSLLPNLLSRVHLPLLPQSYLRTTVSTNKLIKNSLQCRDLLDEARHFQMWQVSRLSTLHLPVNERTKTRKSYGGVIFCIGGRGASGDPFSSIELFSPFYNKWIKLNDMTCCRRHVGCASLNGKIYAVGGSNVSSLHLSTAEVFDPLTNKWSILSSMEIPRRGLGLCSMGGPIYAVGGLDNEHFFSDVERYDVKSNVWKLVSPMTYQRGGVAVVKLKGFMYALGGNCGSITLNSCEVYDPYLDAWSFISSLNQARAGAGAVVLNGFIYVIGGFEGNVPLDTVEKYDPDGDNWSFVCSMKIGRGGVGAATIGGYIYAIGGHNATHYLNTVEIYDAQLDRWESGPEINDCRAGAGVVWCSINASFVDKLYKGKKLI